MKSVLKCKQIVKNKIEIMCKLFLFSEYISNTYKYKISLNYFDKRKQSIVAFSNGLIGIIVRLVFFIRVSPP